MIKVAEWGTGMMGQGLLGYILDRPKDIDLAASSSPTPPKRARPSASCSAAPATSR